MDILLKKCDSDFVGYNLVSDIKRKIGIELAKQEIINLYDNDLYYSYKNKNKNIIYLNKQSHYIYLGFCSYFNIIPYNIIYFNHHNNDNINIDLNIEKIKLMKEIIIIEYFIINIQYLQLFINNIKKINPIIKIHLKLCFNINNNITLLSKIDTITIFNNTKLSSILK